MDDVVLRAMAKWPNVPAVHGWLELDRRGRWLIRGESIGNRAANEFISRNYARDARGRWYFQNGPQRVYVTLAYLPWVYVLDEAGGLSTHTGLAVMQLDSAAIDERFDLVLQTEHGPGLVDGRDLPALSEWFCDEVGARIDDDVLERVIADVGGGESAGDGGGLYLEWRGFRVAVGALRTSEAAERFGFQADPVEES